MTDKFRFASKKPGVWSIDLTLTFNRGFRRWGIHDGVLKFPHQFYWNKRIALVMENQGAPGSENLLHLPGIGKKIKAFRFWL